MWGAPDLRRERDGSLSHRRLRAGAAVGDIGTMRLFQRKRQRFNITAGVAPPLQYPRFRREHRGSLEDRDGIPSA
jgi:hypothetical protein